MSFNIKNTDSFQKGVIATGGGGGDIELPTATNPNEYVVWNNVSKEWVVGGTDNVALGANSSAGTGGSIAIGKNADASNGSQDSIAIGLDAKATNGSIAVGKGAKSFNNENENEISYSNSIILNGSSAPLSSSASNGFFVKPVGTFQVGETNNINIIVYDTNTNEVRTSSTSSIRYKENLEPIQGYKDLLNIEPYLFKYKDSDVTDAGLIAEHIDEYPSLRKLVYYKDYNETDEDGNTVTETKPESVHYQKLGVFNLKLIKDLYEENKMLIEELEQLEQVLE